MFLQAIDTEAMAWFGKRTGSTGYYHFTLFENDQRNTPYRTVLLVGEVCGGELLARATGAENPRDSVNEKVLGLLWRWQAMVAGQPAGFRLDDVLAKMRPDVAAALGDDVGSASFGRWLAPEKEFVVWTLL